VSGRTVLAALVVAAVTLIGVELALGARDYGRVEPSPPCSAAPTVTNGGLDNTLQQIILSALSGAACELGTTREELVLSLSPRTGRRYGSWSDQQLEDALRKGLARAVDDARDRGQLGSVEARVLRELAARAPVRLVVDAARHADSLAALARLLS
jgi:uncharacterized membrane protein